MKNARVGIPARAFSVFAYLCDVYVLEEYQGRGLGKWLMCVVMICPDLRSVIRWVLVTRDAHELYRFPRRHRPADIKIQKGWKEEAGEGDPSPAS